MLRIPAQSDFSQLDREGFPLVEGFRLSIRETSTFGGHIDFVDGAGTALAGFPWWDHAEVALKTFERDHIPCGMRAAPFGDLEQGWQIYIFEEGGFVHVLEGSDPDCTEFSSWFKVRTDDYCRAEKARLRARYPDADILV